MNIRLLRDQQAIDLNAAGTYKLLWSNGDVTTALFGVERSSATPTYKTLWVLFPTGEFEGCPMGLTHPHAESKPERNDQNKEVSTDPWPHMVFGAFFRIVNSRYYEKGPGPYPVTLLGPLPNT
mgnify:CR=1 FL=1